MALEQANSEKPEAQINLTISRKSFFLYEGGNHAISNWGERVNVLYGPHTAAHLKELGASAGYNFDMDAPLSNTMDSHRLVLWAQDQEAGKGEELAQRIGVRYFTQRQPLNDREMLIASTAEIGLDLDAARTYLESDEGYDRVKNSVRQLHAAGVHSIPVFVFRSEPVAYSKAVHGSSDVATFRQIFREIAAMYATSDHETSL